MRQEQPDSVETATVALGTSGYIIDVPKGITVDTSVATIYDLKPGPHVMEISDVQTVDKAIKPAATADPT